MNCTDLCGEEDGSDAVVDVAGDAIGWSDDDQDVGDAQERN